MLKADKSPRTSDRIRSRVIKMQLLDIIYKLLETETYEERIKLCFVLGETTNCRILLDGSYTVSELRL